ncbi:MAG: pyrroline-5-carboxylate reductase [Saezia sp.]
MNTLGIIGAGNMGGTLLMGLIKANYVQPSQVILSGGASRKAAMLAEELGCAYTADNAMVAQNCDTLILGVTSKILPQVLGEIKKYLTSDQLIISLASSFGYDDFYKILPSDSQIAIAIPNLPVAFNAGITAIAHNHILTDENNKKVTKLFKAVGTTTQMDESKLGICTVLAGCSPAFYAMFIEALADAGVMYGLTRNEAYLFAKQAALGSAQMLLQGNMLPATLKDNVASPGGMTIKGIAALEEHGLRNAVIQAVKKATGN